MKALAVVGMLSLAGYAAAAWVYFEIHQALKGPWTTGERIKIR